MTDIADPALAAEVVGLLERLPTAPGGNAAQLELFHRAQELVLHRDASPGRASLLRVAAPFLLTILHQQNAPLVSAILQLLHEATRRDSAFLRELFEATRTLLMLSFATERNVRTALGLAAAALPTAFERVLTTNDAELWAGVTQTLELAGDALTGVIAADGNRGVAVALAASTLLSRAVLLLVPAHDAPLYRDPARSRTNPDAVTIDRAPADHAVLARGPAEALGLGLLRRLTARLGSAVAASINGARESCVLVNALAMLGVMRPQLLVPDVLPSLVALVPATEDRVLRATLRANLIRLLSLPAAQALAEEVTECLIALGDAERAFKAISKSKVPRRKYISAPSEATLRRARIGKRTAERLTESAAQHPPASKRARGGPERISHDTLVDIPAADVVNLVLAAFAQELSAPPPTGVKLLLPPSELKARMSTILARLATPSSVTALEASARRNRDPRRRLKERNAGELESQPSLLPVFDEETVEETADWVSKNSTTVEEPLIAVAEDNSVQVFLKPVSAVWCRDMAAAALSRILENEYGATIRGDEVLRERLVCRLASDPWLLLTDDRNITIQPTKDAKLPAVYQIILDFVLEDITRRGSLATALFYHEYARMTAESLHEDSAAMLTRPPRTGDSIYRKAVAYALEGLSRTMDINSASDKKLFGLVVGQLPLITVEVLRIVNAFLENKTGAVLAITILRDLIKERKTCELPALRVLLRYACDADETCRNTSIRCIANQLYVMDGLKCHIETYATKLVRTLEPTPGAADTPDPSALDVDMEAAATDSTIADPSTLTCFQRRLHALQASSSSIAAELNAYTAQLELETEVMQAPDSEVEILRRLELYLALCAKKPSLLAHIVRAYGHTTELARQVIFQAIEKLIKHLKLRGSVNVVAQLHGFEGASLGLVCHIIQLLSVRGGRSSTVDESTANADLVAQVMDLWHAHSHVPDSMQVLIPVISSVPKETLFPLLPELLSLPQTRWSVAFTRVLEAVPPQVVAPIDLLIGLHHVDLKLEPTMQKKVIAAINFCVEHRHAFPSDVLLHVCRVLVQDERVSKLALRTLILSVTTYPTLQDEMAKLLEILVTRRVWEMEDALWKGFVKCSALIQPASFRMLLEKLPAKQLEAVLSEEPVMRELLRAYATSPDAPRNLRVSDEVRGILDSSSTAHVDVVKTEEEAVHSIEKDDVKIEN